MFDWNRKLCEQQKRETDHLNSKCGCRSTAGKISYSKRSKRDLNLALLLRHFTFPCRIFHSREKWPKSHLTYNKKEQPAGSPSSPRRIVVSDGTSVTEGLQDWVTLQHAIHDGALLKLEALLAVPHSSKIPDHIRNSSTPRATRNIDEGNKRCSRRRTYLSKATSKGCKNSSPPHPPARDMDPS